MDSPVLSPRPETIESESQAFISRQPEPQIEIQKVQAFSLPAHPNCQLKQQIERPETSEPKVQAIFLPAHPKCQPEPQKNPCIYRVPGLITKLNPDDYQPHVVSFGPYHNGEDHLSQMEKHKDLVQDRFFREVESTGPLEDMLPELIMSYDALNPELTDGDKFLKLMIRDGCFMLEIMRAWAAAIEENDYAIEEKIDYEQHDPIYSTHGLTFITPYIRRDMLLLENQLPMPLLYQLVALENNGDAVDEVNELIRKFYFPPEKQKFTGLGQCLHVLDVFRKGLLMETRKDLHDKKNMGREAGEGDKSSVGTGITGMGHVMDIFRKCLPKKTKNVQHEEIIRSATELDEAGIRFKKSKTRSLKEISRSLKEISFARGVLKLPVITVDDTFKSMFLNVMTFERLHSGAGTEVTSYVIFMDNIINDEQDVALLQSHGIIQNAIGSNKAVAELFNSLCKEVTLVFNNSLEAVQKDMSEYCNKRRNRWRAYCNRTYFKNPWTILSLTAAIFLFMLTIIQTVYALLSYY